jgi:hypothetical protein
MFGQPRPTRVATGLLLALVVITAAAPQAGAADPQVAQCLSAAERAQELRNAGKLRATKEQLAVCTSRSCPASVRSDCARWYEEVERAMPTVVLGARDWQGHDRNDVKVSVDGSPLVSSLDGRAVAVDTGTHVLRFEAADVAPVEQSVVLREGDKDRRVEVRFGPPVAHSAPTTETPAPTTTSTTSTPSTPASTATSTDQGATEAAPTEAHGRRRVPTAVWVLGGAGVVAEAVFGIFLWQGYSVAGDLNGNKHCPPGCPPGDVDAMSRDFVIADVALYAGIGLLGAAAVVYFALPSPSASPANGHVEVRVRSARGGAVLGLGGEF